MRFVFALLPAAFIAGALYAVPAEAKCSDFQSPCAIKKAISIDNKKAEPVANKKVVAASKKKKATLARAKLGKKKATFAQAKLAKKKTHRVAQTRKLRAKPLKTYAAFRVRDEGTTDHGHVVAMIKSMAPSHGVPTWFALRIAKVESGYNPRVRGRAGEIGVFQLKCQTARGLGFRGSCGQLADARTNVQWGLKHLSMAIASSSGNLRLAASKHNGGLGRKRLVHSYVAKVF
jgi:soluble lytic murein transglycosylase-like protein